MGYAPAMRGVALRRLAGRSLAFVAAVSAAVAAAPIARADAPCATPPADDDWAVATPEAAGFDGRALCAVLEGVAAGTANVHAVLVERHGRLVAELYRTGRDHPIDERYGIGFGANVAFDANALHDVRSISKSVVGLLVGIAVRDGKIQSLSAPALDAFPELADLRTNGREAITIEHLLTMSSGLDWNEWDASVLASDETRLFWKADPVRFAFDRPLAHPPGTVFNYDGGLTTTLAALLARATGRSIDDLAREQIFEPLGIERWVWVRDLHDRPLAFAGLRLRPRDMAKLGRLLLQGGRFGDREVVPAAWIAASLRPHIGTGDAFGPDPPPFAPRGYGYQWWTGRIAWHGRELDWNAGLGNGGQRVFVVPALDVTLVTTAGDYGSIAIGRAVGRIFADVVAAVAE